MAKMLKEGSVTLSQACRNAVESNKDLVVRI
jgi:hypothetical protein